jgi:outer membrane lipoprotein-sorting protein
MTVHSKLSFLFILLFTIAAAGQEDAASLHKQLADKFSSAQSLRIVAQSQGVSVEPIRILAKRGEKFRITLGDREVICDGTTVWNYTASRKNVVVTRLKSRANSLSLEKLFLDILSKYRPESLKNENNSSGGSRYVLKLVPDSLTMYGVKAITIGIQKKGRAISSLEIESDQGAQQWTIRSIETNVDLSDSVFRFKASKDIEVIDMRD